MDNREYQNYEEKDGTTKPIGVLLTKLEQECMKEQRELEENHLAQQPLLLINNAHFCYDGHSPTSNDNEKKQHFYSIKKNIKYQESSHR